MATYDELSIEVRLHGSRNQKVKCPVCRDQRKDKNDKSLSVNINTGAYNCHYCGWKGYADGITEADKKQQWAADKKRQYAKPDAIELPLDQKVIDWFAKRHITRETLQYFKVSQSCDWMPGKGETKAGKRNCINFNYYRNGEKVNVKYRDALKCFRMVADAELILYNLDSLKNATDALICEGEIDCMAFYQSGHFRAVSVPNGASKGSARLEYIDNCADVFAKMTKIIIAVDADEAGNYLRDELCRRLGRDRCWLVEYPDGCKDANEVLVKYGSDELRKMWLSAAPPPLESVLVADDLKEKMDDIYLNGWPAREPIGYDELDRMLNFAPGEVTTVTGIPGHGKDEFIGQVLMRKAARYGHRAAIFNYEEPAEIITIKYIQKYIGKPFHRKDRAEMISPAQKDAAYKFMNEHFFIIDIDTANLTIDGLIEKGIELVLRKGIKFFAIGPYNCIENRREKDQTEGEYIGTVMQKLTRFARVYDVHVFFVAHPTKQAKENGKLSVPTLYNIAGSANFFNMTNNGLTVYRNYEDDTTDIYIQKVKFFFNGKLGFTTFKYDPHTGRYQEPGLDFESELRSAVLAYEEPIEEPARPDPIKEISSHEAISNFEGVTFHAEPLETAPF